MHPIFAIPTNSVSNACAVTVRGSRLRLSSVRQVLIRNLSGTSAWNVASPDGNVGKIKEAKSGKRTSPYALDADDLRILEHGNLTQSEWGSPNAGDSEEGLSQLARAQLAINERDLLIARQALRIDELERVLRQFVER